MVVKLGIEAADCPEIFHCVRAHDHAVGVARAGDGLAFGQKLGIGGDAEIRNAVLPQEGLEPARRADRDSALVNNDHAPRVAAAGQQGGDGA